MAVWKYPINVSGISACATGFKLHPSDQPGSSNPPNESSSWHGIPGAGGLVFIIPNSFWMDKYPPDGPQRLFEVTSSSDGIGNFHDPHWDIVASNLWYNDQPLVFE